MEQTSSAGRQAATEQPPNHSSSSSNSKTNSSSSSNSSSGQGKSAFMTLAGYIFGKNDRQEKMAMTMPVFSDSSGRMQFFMGTGKVCDSAPQQHVESDTPHCLPKLFSCKRTCRLVVVMHDAQHSCGELVALTLCSRWQAKRPHRVGQTYRLHIALCSTACMTFSCPSIEFTVRMMFVKLNVEHVPHVVLSQLSLALTCELQCIIKQSGQLPLTAISCLLDFFIK